MKPEQLKDILEGIRLANLKLDRLTRASGLPPIPAEELLGSNVCSRCGTTYKQYVDIATGALAHRCYCNTQLVPYTQPGESKQTNVVPPTTTIEGE